MVHMFKYMAHPEQEQENQIILGKLLMLSTFCEVGGGFRIEKGDFRSDSMTFPEFMRSRTHMSALFLNATRFAEYIYEKTCLGMYGF